MSKLDISQLNLKNDLAKLNSSQKEQIKGGGLVLQWTDIQGDGNIAIKFYVDPSLVVDPNAIAGLPA
jgi:hypothetical protein